MAAAATAAATTGVVNALDPAPVVLPSGDWYVFEVDLVASRLLRVYFGICIVLCLRVARENSRQGSEKSGHHSNLNFTGLALTETGRPFSFSSVPNPTSSTSSPVQGSQSFGPLAPVDAKIVRGCKRPPAVDKWRATALDLERLTKSTEEQHCITARGGVFNPTASKKWTSWGEFFLGLDYLGYGGKGLYGLDSINSWSPVTNIAFGMSNALIATFNTTDYFTGLFGLGISQGRFKNNIGESPLTQAVKTFGWIPSYSYGYTAGAHYRNIPQSLTLGGYDSSRFEEHDNEFTITQLDKPPRVNIRSLNVYNKNKPGDWSSSTNVLSTYNDTFSAMIESTTPYLWLPESICDNFASALNLTYNETFQLYTITNDQYQDYSSSSDAYSFTFTLSSIDNHDNFGLPLNAPGVVNITVPIRAFVGSLQYPFQKEAIKYGQPAVPYFMLRKAVNASDVIIGRSFLQEAYIRTKYDSAVFSVHQAAFPQDPDKNAKPVAIKQPSNSPYPAPPPSEHSHGLTTAQMVGIAVGVVAFCTILVAGLCFWGRRRKQKKRGAMATKEDDAHDTSSTIAPDSPMTPVSRILSKIVRRKRSRRATTTTTSTTGPTEVPASEIYELPAPMPPAELAAHDDDDSMLGDTEAGTDDSQNLSAYELARRKLDRQLAGPVPAYAPPANGVMPLEKEPEIVTTQLPRVTTVPQPVYHLHNVSPVRSHEGLGTNSMSGTLPSPVSPRTDWNTNDLPSPITASLPPNSTFSQTGSAGRRRGGSNTMNGAASDPGSASRSNSNSSSDSNGQNQNKTRESRVTFPLPQATFQRAPIEPSKVVCLGPLPENVSLFRQQMLSNAAGTDERPHVGSNAHHRPSTGSLGSNFTDDEDAMAEEMTRPSASRSYGSHNASRAPTFTNPLIRTVLPTRTEEENNVSPTSDKSGADSEGSGGRIGGDDLIHVPQMADKRYSWEEER